MSSLADLAKRNEHLERELEDARQTVAALASGAVDSVAMEGVTTPILVQAAQQQLREREHMLRAIFEGALDGMLLADDDGKYLDANPAACALMSLPRDALIGRRIGEFAAPDYATSDEWQSFGEQGKLRGLFPLLRPDGQRRILEYSAVANVLPGIHLSVLRDVTENKAAEEALRKTQYFLEEAQRVAQIGCWVAPFSDAPLFWTAEAYRIAGVPSGSPLTLQSFFETVVHPEDRSAVQEAVDRAIAGDSAYQIEHRIVRPDGEVRWVLERAKVDRDQTGTPLRMIGVTQDITELRRATDQLRASEARYRMIVETTSEGVWLVDAGFVTTFVNERMAEMLGYPRDELIGRHVFELMDAEAVAFESEKWKRREQGVSEVYENRYQRKDGTTLWVLAKTNPVFDEGGRFAGSVGLFSDMTERRKSEEARNRLAAIVQSSHDAIISKSLAGTITSWNRGAERLFGYSEDEMLGRPITDLFPPERLEEEREIMARISRGETVEDFDTVRVKKDGSRVDVSLLISPVRGSNGEIVHIAKIARDMTERRKAEAALRRSEEQLRQSQKMEAIGRLAAGVAHDFNNLLSVILSYANLLVEELTPADPMRADLDEIRKAGQRAADLTRQLLAFSRRQMLQPSVLDPNRSLAGLQKMLTRVLGEDIELTLLPCQDVGKVYVDPGQFEQVVMNLVVNARDAMPRGGNLTIETVNVVMSEQDAAEHPGITPGPNVMIVVADTGVGIDRETLPRIFDPFFTTKAEGKGTGLGLSTVYGILQQSGGHISVDSQPGAGTTFKVYLPRTDRRSSRPVPDQRRDASQGGDETILLVEDEDQVRAVARSILRQRGYNVLEAQNGGEAFLISERYDATIHLLLTDVVMPRMSGRELAERLRVARPEMKVLYVSGYTTDTTVLQGALEMGVAFLQKPLTPEALASKVRDVLDGVKRNSLSLSTVGTQEEAAPDDADEAAAVLPARVAHELNNPLASVITNLELAMRDIAGASVTPPSDDLLEILQDARDAAERVRHIVRDFGTGSRRDGEVRGPAGVQRLLESTPRLEPSVTRRGRLLVIDDDASVTRAVKRMLQREHDVSVAHAAAPVLEALAAGQRFDAILCDLMMPKLSGVDFFTALQRIDPDQARRVVFLTGGAFTTAARELLTSTSNPSLEKPLDSHDLRAVVSALIQ
jgi:PAS domain S-box-containing protein